MRANKMRIICAGLSAGSAVTLFRTKRENLHAEIAEKNRRDRGEDLYAPLRHFARISVISSC
jgi:hypothetical protein